jgi:CRISPR-associated protein Cas2
MSRRSYFVSYDISDDKRRANVYKILLDYGDRVQFSVFMCELTARERVQLKALLETSLNAAEDQVILLDLGNAPLSIEGGFECIGMPYLALARVQVV